MLEAAEKKVKIELIDKKVPLVVFVFSAIMTSIGFVFTLIFTIPLIWGIIVKEIDAIFFLPEFLIAAIILTIGILLRIIRKSNISGG